MRLTGISFIGILKKIKTGGVLHQVAEYLKYLLTKGFNVVAEWWRCSGTPQVIKAVKVWQSGGASTR